MEISPQTFFDVKNSHHCAISYNDAKGFMNGFAFLGFRLLSQASV